MGTVFTMTVPRKSRAGCYTHPIILQELPLCADHKLSVHTSYQLIQALSAEPFHRTNQYVHTQLYSLIKTTIQLSKQLLQLGGNITNREVTGWVYLRL